MTQPVDRSILQEIVHIVEARRKVPERVRVRAREYLITYLEDHQRRLQEALQRYDSDRLNMLYGQLASKVKYQMLRRLPARATARPKAAKKKAAGTGTPKVAKGRVTQKAAPSKSSKKVASKKAATKKLAPKKTAAKKVAAKKSSAKKVAAKKSSAKKVAAKKSSAKKGTAKTRVVKKPSASRKHK